MAKRSPKSSSKSDSSSLLTENASVEAAWRDALAFQDIGKNERTKSRKRLAQAQVARARAENEAITATRDYCGRVRAEADEKLLTADRALARAQRIKTDAAAWAASSEEEIQFRLVDASRKRSHARSYAEKVESAARGAADALMTQTREGAAELASRMRHDAAEDIRKILSNIEVTRAAAEDELATQQLLTETARIRAFSVGLNVEDARGEILTLVAAPKKQGKTAKRAVSAKKPAKRTVSAKKKPVKLAASARKRPVKITAASSNARSKSARKAA